jgi:regulator of sigma E protease
MTFLTILAALVMLGIMIMVHEFGHFISARMTGIAVQQFSIGFGPKLFGWKSKKHDTEFMVRLIIPIGGYCMFYGEDDAQGKHVDDPRSYYRQNVWKRMFSVLMGPAMNLVLAFVVAVGLFFIGGIQGVVPYAETIEPNSPAAQAGMEPGDIFLSINGQDVQDGSTDKVVAITNAFKEGDAPLEVIVLRGQENTEVTLHVTPFYDTQEQRPRMGIGLGGIPQNETRRISIGEAVSRGYILCVDASKLILGGLRDLIFKGQGLEESAGPVGIVQQISVQTQQYGLQGYLYLLIILSINLGLVNLLPIPGLDGSRFLFMLVEAIFRKPVNRRAEAMIHLAGFAILISAMIFLTYRDIQRLIQ